MTLRSSRATAVLSALVCLFLTGYFVSIARDEARVRTASRLALRGDLRGALTEARAVDRQPTANSADRVAAYALAALGRDREAATAFATALRDSPNDWVLERDRAIVLARLGRRGPASLAMARAAKLNPKLRLPAGFVR